MSTDLLRIQEERAERGVLEFADAMREIRDGKLYPNAWKSDGDTGQPAWKAYCKERWNMSGTYVDDIIRAAPVLRRRAQTAVADGRLSVNAASRVANLDVEVQDAILNETTNADEVRAKAKAARDVARAGLSVNEQIKAVDAVRSAKKKKHKTTMKSSKFVKLLGPAWGSLTDAANYAQTNVLTPMENDWAWEVINRMRYQLERLDDRVTKPSVLGDMDEMAAFLLAGDES